MNDAELMNSTILGIGETHLHEGEEIHLNGFDGHFANAGKGKGVAAFSKIGILNVTNILQPTFSAIVLELENLKIIFAYLSNPAMHEIDVLTPLLSDKTKPMILMGDMNFHFSERQHPLKTYFEKCGFRYQMIKKITHDEGHILDHIYSDFYIIDENVHQKPLYFSDHDAISLCITNDVRLERSLNKLTLE